jgi:hypothetical protein
MQDLMRAMAHCHDAADEFSPALITFPLSDMMRQLQDEAELEAGDLEGARQMADSSSKPVNMVAALQNNAAADAWWSLDAMSQQLMESSNKLADLVKRQEKVLEGTQDIDQESLNRLNEAQQQAFDTVQRRFEQELNDLARLAGEMVRRARQHSELDTAFQDAYQQLLRQLHAVRKSLQEHELPQVTEDLAEAERQLAWMRQRAERLSQPDRMLQQQIARAQQHVHAAQQALEGLPQDRQAMLTPSQRGQLGELGQNQGGVRNDTQTLQQEVQRLLPLMPFLPAELGQAVARSPALYG